MPRASQRAKKLIFTKTKKKGVDEKRHNMEKVRELVDKYSYIYVFDCDNYRNPIMKELKNTYESSRFYQGKVAPTIVALGKTKEDEYRENLSLISEALKNNTRGAHRGLLFANLASDEIIKYFNNFTRKTAPKTGFVATDTFVVKKGELNEFIFSQEYQLRKLGLPIILKNGRLLLEGDYIICKQGQSLRPEQCKLLELFNQNQAEFRLNIRGYWHDNQYHECLENKLPLKTKEAPQSHNSNNSEKQENKESKENKENKEKNNVNDTQFLSTLIEKNAKLFGQNKPEFDFGIEEKNEDGDGDDDEENMS